MSHLQDFVDREEELEIFLQMLSAEREERVLDICAGGGTGKSYLLRRMWQQCNAQDVPCALAEFASTWQPDPPKLMRELAERLGEVHLPTFCQQAERCRGAPASGGDAASLREQWQIHCQNLAELEKQRAQHGITVPVHIIQGIEHEEAKIARLEAQLQAAEGGLAEGQEQLLRALSRAFCDDLLALAADRPAVLLLDGYEHTPGETADWIQKWLLQKSVCEQATQLIVVLAGRPAGARPCFEPWGTWWRMVVRRERLSSLQYEHVRAYYCEICGLPLEETHLLAYYDAVQDNPYLMAQIAASLGGRR
jgi:hypothetical protein